MTAAATRDRKAGGSRQPANSVAWRDVAPAPLILLAGPEEFLASRALQSIRGQLRENVPELELTRLDAAAYTAGELEMAASPSLFSTAKMIEISALATMNEDFLADALTYLQEPAEDVVVVLHHAGGARGRKLLDALKGSGVPVVDCQPLKKDAEKADFAAREFRLGRRRIESDALSALVAAVGANLAELAAGCAQLISDTDGTITAQMVEQYYGGRVEATAFRVADAAVAGRGAVALSTLRHALATGVDPVPLVATLAMKVRTIAKVAGSRGSSAQLARELGMQPWQVDQARRDAAGWTPQTLVAAIKVLAEADAQVKGAAKDPVYALERAVTLIATSVNPR